MTSNQNPIDKTSEILNNSGVHVTKFQTSIASEQLEKRTATIANSRVGSALQYCKIAVDTCALGYYRQGNYCYARDFAASNCKTKLSIDERCSSATYPCKELLCSNGYSPIYELVCPQRWVNRNGLCIPPDSYEGHCNNVYELKKASLADRQLFSFLCNAPYDCSLSESLETRCPEGYKHDKYKLICSTDTQVDTNCKSVHSIIEPIDAYRFEIDCDTRFNFIDKGDEGVNYKTCAKNFENIGANICKYVGNEKLPEDCPELYAPLKLTEDSAKLLETICKYEFSHAYVGSRTIDGKLLLDQLKSDNLGFNKLTAGKNNNIYNNKKQNIPNKLNNQHTTE